jgi:NADH dehydrogenase
MILLVGGTGSLGGRIARELLRQGEPLRILVRPGSEFQALEEAGAEVVYGDLKDPDSVAHAVVGAEIVVTTANSAKRDGEDDIESVDRRGNRTLIDAARVAGVRRFVFVSGLGADLQSPVPFLRAKAETETHLRESGLEYTIIQPNICRDSWFPTLIEGAIAAGRPVTLVGEAKRRHSFVAEADVARFILAALRHPAARNTTLVIGGPAALTWRDVVKVYEEATNQTIEVRTVQMGQPLPGLPEIVSQLATGFESYDSPIPMDQICATYGITLTTAREFAERS